jgi:hypothetical protein
MMSARGGRRPGRPRPRRLAGLRTPGTDRRVWLARGVPGVRWRQVLRQGAGQRVEQEMAGAEIGAGGPDAHAGDELDSGGRGGPAVDVQSHAQQRAQRSPGQADLDPARARAAIVLDRPAQQAVAEPQVAAPPRWAASCQVRPRTSRTGRRRSAGMTAIPAPGPCSRSCFRPLSSWPRPGLRGPLASGQSAALPSSSLPAGCLPGTPARRF